MKFTPGAVVTIGDLNTFWKSKNGGAVIRIKNAFCITGDMQVNNLERSDRDPSKIICNYNENQTAHYGSDSPYTVISQRGDEGEFLDVKAL